MISKEQFLNAISALKSQREFDDKFATLMTEAFPGSFPPAYNNLLWEKMIDLLSAAMDDTGEAVWWWVVDCDFGRDNPDSSPEVGGKPLQRCVTTAEDLYMLLSGQTSPDGML